MRYLSAKSGLRLATHVRNDSDLPLSRLPQLEEVHLFRELDLIPWLQHSHFHHPLSLT